MMYVDRELVRRVEQTAAEFCARQVDALAGAAAQECDGGWLIAFGPGRYVNRAMAIGLGGTAADEIVANVTGFYSAHSLPASVEINPWVDASLVRALSDAGFRLERFRNVYVRELSALPDQPAADIRPVDVASALARKAILAADVAADSEARRISDEYCDAVAQLGDSCDLVAIIDGVPVACGSLTVVRGIAGLGGAATLATHRGRGLQQALLIHRLHLAADVGCDFASATAVPDGQSARNLERLGFQLLYTQTVLTTVA